MSQALDFKKKILIGKDTEDAFVLEMSQNPYFSITGEIYAVYDIFDYNEGEFRARKDLEEGEIWRECVASGECTRGLDEWIDDVLNIDGWQHVLGDVYEVGYDRYVRLNGIGQITLPDKFEDLRVTKEDLEIIKEGWKKLHLKPIAEMSGGEARLLAKVREVFNKYPEFDTDNLAIYDPDQQGVIEN